MGVITMIYKKIENYYPFGMVMPGRNFSNDDYRYGVKAKEKDNEETQTYADFINTSLIVRNKSKDMMTSSAAAINALVGGTDYTRGKNGEIGTQERGVGKGTVGSHNRFFTSYLVSSSNQITSFENESVPNT